MEHQLDLFGESKTTNKSKVTKKKPNVASLVLSKVNTSKYDKLNKKIAKLHREKNRLKSTIENIQKVNEIFLSKIAPLEKQHLKLKEDYLLKLDAFLDKKNIPNRYLDFAIMEICTTLDYLAFHEVNSNVTLEMMDKYQKPDFSDMSEEDKELSRETFEDMKAQFAEQSGSEFPFSFDDFLSTPLEELMKEFQQNIRDEFIKEEENQKAEIKKERQNFDDDVFKKMYKKLAKVLHPDLNNTLIPNESKEQLIKELSEAWENRNYIKILEIHSYVFPDEKDFKFSAKQVKNLEQQINTELRDIKDAFHQIKYSEGKELDIYTYFYSKNKKKQNVNFSRGMREVQEKIDLQKEINSSVFKSVKKTKDFLNSKLEAAILSDMTEKLMELGLDDNFFDI